MNSLQLFGSIRRKSTLGVKIYSFTQGERIKLLNYTSKSLYGPVINTKPPKTSNKLVKHVKQPETRAETNFSSEMYWVIEKNWNHIFAEDLEDVTIKELTPNKRKRIFKSNVKKTSLQPKSDDSTKPPETKETDVTNSNVLEPPLVRKSIPLSDEELNKVLWHPLLTDVLSAPPSDIRSPELRNVPSVGKVLQYTMSESARNALMNWKLSKIQELGEAGFADLQQTNLNSGKMFHSSIQDYFLTNEVPIASSPVYKLWESVRGVLDTFTAMPDTVEQPVFHPTLKYKGIADCVSEVNNGYSEASPIGFAKSFENLIQSILC